MRRLSVVTDLERKIEKPNTKEMTYNLLSRTFRNVRKTIYKRLNKELIRKIDFCLSKLHEALLKQSGRIGEIKKVRGSFKDKIFKINEIIKTARSSDAMRQRISDKKTAERLEKEVGKILLTAQRYKNILERMIETIEYAKKSLIERNKLPEELNAAEFSESLDKVLNSDNIFTYLQEEFELPDNYELKRRHIASLEDLGMYDYIFDISNYNI